jgi:beta-lactamase superfamily II metal-dependent hydrolase
MHSPPSADEFEVSIFGPGFGESCVLHLGNNCWVVVDSCLDPASKEVIPLSYLRSIGVDPSQDIYLIVATHWHDDHIRGLAEILEASHSARFVCSDALRSQEFTQLVCVTARSVGRQTSGVSEFSKIIKILKTRKNAQLGGAHVPIWAIADRCVWTREDQNSSIRGKVSLYSLSPSDAAVYQSKLRLASLMPRIHQPKSRVPELCPNDSSVVILATTGTESVLLGADLEECCSGLRCWSAIVESSTRPQESASVFKVPHHGSGTSEHDGVWENLLTTDPVALLTPFVLGNVVLPSNKDINRIREHTTRAYATGQPIVRKSRTRLYTVEKQIRETVRYIRPVFSSTGQVRLRGQISNSPIGWRVELFNGAISLN